MSLNFALAIVTKICINNSFILVRKTVINVLTSHLLIFRREWIFTRNIYYTADEVRIWTHRTASRFHWQCHSARWSARRQHTVTVAQRRLAP